MPTPILMPALSPTMTEGNLAKWVKKEGDEVHSGDVIAEIETDKATMEVEAVDEGTLGRILVAEGTEGVAVNTPIAMLLDEGEDRSALDEGKPAAEKRPNGDGQARGDEAPPPPTTSPSAAAAAEEAGAAGDGTPAAPPPPRPQGSGPEGRQSTADGERVFASPLARRMAGQAGLDLKAMSGSGPNGRIVKADIEAAMAAPKGERPAATERSATAKPSAPAGDGKAAEAGPPKQAGQSALTQPTAPQTAAYEEIPLNSMRKVIAKRLAEAKQTIPHFYLSLEVELDALMAMRAQLNGREGADYKLSVNDFIIKATALALRRVPGCNAAWGGDKIYQYKDVDVSVAVAIEGGLITPIVRKADQKGLSTISNEMKDLAARAKAGKLKPDEFQGGGFSISNLGMYGISAFQAVINPPQACILAVGAGIKKPVVKDGAVAVATMMTATLSVDHRAVDGALGAQFLAALKKLVEDPLALLL